ncbi:unnamed protein product [Prorocentrum cordatum]|uniref:Uncharacterized protein n=1 Tax=Prorocentrum cordatum TaxID=2364126 RepID=A0ABN9U8H9_9DINO|nr:unnamed protein product [Polarella glacialis]
MDPRSVNVQGRSSDRSPDPMVITRRRAPIYCGTARRVDQRQDRHGPRSAERAPRRAQEEEEPLAPRTTVPRTGTGEREPSPRVQVHGTRPPHAARPPGAGGGRAGPRPVLRAGAGGRCAAAGSKHGALARRGQSRKSGAQILKQAPVAGRQPRMHKASRHGGSPSPRPPLRAAGRGHHMYKRRPRAERRWGRRTAGPSARGPGEAPRPLSAGEGAPRRAAPPAWWHRIGRRGGKRS